MFLSKLAAKVGAAVSTTWNGKGVIPEDHALSIGAIGQTGTLCGNQITAGADVVMSVGRPLVHRLVGVELPQGRTDRSRLQG